jgi:hypothetical protein
MASQGTSSENSLVSYFQLAIEKVVTNFLKTDREFFEFPSTFDELQRSSVKDLAKKHGLKTHEIRRG